MKFVVQRVKNASVTVPDTDTGENVVTGSIGHGFLVLMGVTEGDTEEICDRMLDKLVKLRIFADEEGKTNRSITDVGGKILLVSQFTLYADCRKGNRPSFVHAGDPKTANDLYEYAKRGVISRLGSVECGIFGADMQVSLQNDGPFTILLDSRELF